MHNPPAHAALLEQECSNAHVTGMSQGGICKHEPSSNCDDDHSGVIIVHKHKDGTLVWLQLQSWL